MLIEDRRTDRSDAILHHQIVAVVSQCVSRGVVVEPRDDRADAAAFRSSLGAYLIEPNLLKAYAVFCFWICLIQFLDMKSLEVDRLFLNGGLHHIPQRQRFAALGDEDDCDYRDNGDANCGEAKRPSLRKKERQRHQDQDHYPQHCLYFHSSLVISSGHYAQPDHLLSPAMKQYHIVAPLVEQVGNRGTRRMDLSMLK